MMRWFQVTVVILLLAITGELAIITMRLPIASVEAQSRARTTALPVVLVDGGPLDCPSNFQCARLAGASLSTNDPFSRFVTITNAAPLPVKIANDELPVRIEGGAPLQTWPVDVRIVRP